MVRPTTLRPARFAAAIAVLIAVAVVGSPPVSASAAAGPSPTACAVGPTESVDGSSGSVAAPAPSATVPTTVGPSGGAEPVAGASPCPSDRPTQVHATVPSPWARATTVTWTAPAVGAPTAYQVRCIPTELPFTAGPSDVVRYVASVTTTATVNDLAGGRRYRCYVRARYGPDPTGLPGEADEGPLSAASDVIAVPVGTPLPSVDVRSTEPPMPDGRSTVVTFADPVNVSGAPITGHVVTCGSSNGGLQRTATGVTSPVTVTGLTAGKRYACAVQAGNAVGLSRLVWDTNEITVPGGPVTGVTASTPSAARPWTFVRFRAPDGGPPVTYYVVACVPLAGGATRTDVTRDLQAQVNGLARGSSYRCRVTATSDGRGSGPVSAWSNTVTVPLR